MSFSMCRVCLVDTSRMLNINNIHLVKIYEKMTNTKLNVEADKRMPSTICFVCHRQLQKCHRFFNMAHKSNRILRELLHKTDEQSQATLITPSQEIMHHLVVTPIQHSTINICPNDTSTSPVPVMKEIPVKGETAKNKDIDEKELKLERLDEDNNKCNDLTPTCHTSVNTCSYNISISPVTVKEEPVAVKMETAKNEDFDDISLKLERLDENIEKCNDLTSTYHMSVNTCSYTISISPVTVKEEQVPMKGETADKDIEILISNNIEQSQENDIDLQTSSMHLYFYCDVCNKKFSNKYLLVKHLTSHIRVHTGRKLYSCNICQKTFTHYSNLTSHMRVHTGEKPFTCNMCDKTFTNKNNMTRHLRVHTGERPYPCNRCDKAFIDNSNLTKHMRVHTGERPYPCNMCDKAFNQKYHLSCHMRVHTGEKPYPCNRCDKVFTYKSGLKRHMLVHTGQKQFPCNRCEKSFTDKCKLTRHMQRLHPKEISDT